ncbi:MAG: BolA family transcriptional regulator [bacterium]|nr:BolA family transcriptional regulator [bacterium]
MTSRQEQLQDLLQEKFSIRYLDVIDESHKHKGHASAPKEGQSHFQVLIITDDFKDKSRVMRHKMVYEALGNAFEEGVHALSIRAFTPIEWAECFPHIQKG